jgi:DNA-binding CsgD family transcriptional regulator/tetratricopeptide (TPR) repeat protein
VGREGELAELEAVLADASAGRPTIAFLAGESGIGKTRLLSEFERRASAGDPPVRVMGGDCVELGEGELPYAPIVGALRPLARQHDPVLDGLPAATRAELGALIPGLGGAAASERLGADGDDAAQARLFEALLTLFDELGRDRTLLLSIEDIHWADSSTRAFLAFLARSLCSERVMVVASYRPDELHRRHPLRPLLAELERNASARRLELSPLTRAELREQLADILGAEPDKELLERMWARSEGNPLFTEELLAGGLDGRGAMPPTLRDALMVRVERLSEAAQEVLRLVAIARRVDTELLSGASPLEPAELRVALREAVASHILTADEDGSYRFRHALLREVVADDLLPGERTEFHLQLARALERRAAEQGEGAHLAAGIAHHYYAAGDQTAALAASVRAADAADSVHAHGEAAALLDRALELWDRVPDAETITGVDYIELLRRAAFDNGAMDDFPRKEQLLKKALELVDREADPRRAASLMEALARTQWSLNHAEDAIETGAHALALLPEDEPTIEAGRVLGWLAKVRMLQGRYVAALEVASEAIEVGQAVGDTLAEARARNARGISLAALGDVEAGTAELRKAVEIARERDNANEMGSAYANLADALNAAGRSRQALEVVEDAQRIVAERLRHTDWLNTMIAEFKFLVGEWDDAERWMPSRERRQVGTSLMYIALQRVTMALGRGDHATAREYLEAIGDNIAQSTEPQFLGAWGALSAMLDLREGDIEAARAAIDEALDRIEFCTEDASRIVRLSAVGVAIEADAAQRARDLGEDPGPALARAEIMLARVRAAAEGDRPVERAWLAVAEAQWTRAEGNTVPLLWERAAEEWDALEWPYEAALMRWRLAEAHLTEGDRAAASSAASAALATAHRLGARWLENEIEGLCARGRLQFDGVPVPGRDEPEDEEPERPEEEPFGLTPRERQVLTLVSEGRTNREIGDTLFMAEKTASVHVSRILSKLGVRSRTEAAAVAHRLGLDAASGTGRPAAGA